MMASDIEIIDYKDKYHEDFKRLNLEWLDKYNLTESHDLMVLDDPRGAILNSGGFIWLVKSGNSIVGSVALIRETNEIYELGKMAVTAGFQGKGISKKLIEVCLAKAKKLHVKKITLFSNHQLQTALKLYEKYGFRNVEAKGSPFATADVKMELVL